LRVWWLWSMPVVSWKSYLNTTLDRQGCPRGALGRSGMTKNKRVRVSIGKRGFVPLTRLGHIWTRVFQRVWNTKTRAR
jgi:hypothetical protein